MSNSMLDRNRSLKNDFDVYIRCINLLVVNYMISAKLTGPAS